MGSKLSADRLIGGGKDDVWTFGSPGVGFGLLGSVSVQHPELDEAELEVSPQSEKWFGSKVMI